MKKKVIKKIFTWIALILIVAGMVATIIYPFF
jgi:hypothetical protein